MKILCKKEQEIRIEEIELYPYFSISSSHGKVRMVSKRFVKRYNKIMKKFNDMQERLDLLYQQ